MRSPGFGLTGPISTMHGRGLPKVGFGATGVGGPGVFASVRVSRLQLPYQQAFDLFTNGAFLFLVRCGPVVGRLWNGRRHRLSFGGAPVVDVVVDVHVAVDRESGLDLPGQGRNGVPAQRMARQVGGVKAAALNKFTWRRCVRRRPASPPTPTCSGPRRFASRPGPAASGRRSPRPGCRPSRSTRCCTP